MAGRNFYSSSRPLFPALGTTINPVIPSHVLTNGIKCVNVRPIVNAVVTDVTFYQSFFWDVAKSAGLVPTQFTHTSDMPVSKQVVGGKYCIVTFIRSGIVILELKVRHHEVLKYSSTGRKYCKDHSIMGRTQLNTHLMGFWRQPNSRVSL